MGLYWGYPQRKLREVQYARRVPTIRDRVVQAAAKIVLEPILEADFEDSAYGYRPRRGAVDAVKEAHRPIRPGYTDVVDADFSKYVNAGARLHRFPEQRCINNADENALEHGLGSWASGWGHIVFGRVGVVAA